MAKKLYVGNLSFKVTGEDLGNLFSEVGSVESVTIISDRLTGRSKGFGFVEMEGEAADKAVARFHGLTFEGRPLTVNEARPIVQRGDQGGSRGGNKGGFRG